MGGGGASFVVGGAVYLLGEFDSVWGNAICAADLAVLGAMYLTFRVGSRAGKAITDRENVDAQILIRELGKPDSSQN